MVMCLLSRGSRGHWTKLNHEERRSKDRKSPFIGKKSEILLKIEKIKSTCNRNS
jgi:hypothetical protein